VLFATGCKTAAHPISSTIKWQMPYLAKHTFASELQLGAQMRKPLRSLSGWHKNAGMLLPPLSAGRHSWRLLITGFHNWVGSFR
jgi:hypothetical protein